MEAEEPVVLGIAALAGLAAVVLFVVVFLRID
jgi:hypothetical protein